MYLRNLLWLIAFIVLCKLEYNLASQRYVLRKVLMCIIYTNVKSARFLEQNPRNVNTEPPINGLWLMTCQACRLESDWARQQVFLGGLKEAVQHAGAEF